jgi:hypothetical protein
MIKATLFGCLLVMQPIPVVTHPPRSWQDLFFPGVTALPSAKPDESSAPIPKWTLPAQEEHEVKTA